MTRKRIEADVDALESEHARDGEVSLDAALRAMRASETGEARSPGAFLRPGVEPPPVLATVSAEGFLVLDPVPGRGEGIDVGRLDPQAQTEAVGTFASALDLDINEAADVLADASEGSA